MSGRTRDYPGPPLSSSHSQIPFQNNGQGKERKNGEVPNSWLRLSITAQFIPFSLSSFANKGCCHFRPRSNYTAIIPLLLFPGRHSSNLPLSFLPLFPFESCSAERCFIGEEKERVANCQHTLNASTREEDQTSPLGAGAIRNRARFIRRIHSCPKIDSASDRNNGIPVLSPAPKIPIVAAAAAAYADRTI